MPDGKPVEFAFRLSLAHAATANVRGHRVTNCRLNMVQLLAISLDDHSYSSVGQVLDNPAYVKVTGEPCHGVSEPDPLHSAVKQQFPTFGTHWLHNGSDGTPFLCAATVR